MIVRAEIEEIELDGDYSRNPIDSVRATCTRCDNCSESYGTSEDSIKRSLVQLRETCPRGERNFYSEKFISINEMRSRREQQPAKAKAKVEHRKIRSWAELLDGADEQEDWPWENEYR